MSVLTSIFGVFSEVSEWIVAAISGLIPMFYTAEAGLTFLGVLATASLCVSICLLLVSIIQNFLHFRG